MTGDNNNLLPAKNDPEAEDRKKDLPQFGGVVQVQRKEKDGFVQWLCRLLFSGRKPKDILLDVLEHDVVPTMQDGLYNSGVSLLGKTIYRENQRPGTSSGGVPGSFVNYVSFSDKKKQQQAAIEASRSKEEETIKSGFENPAFPSLEDAKQFLNAMHGYAQKYDQMSVHDLAWMQKKNADYTWEKYGWDSEEILAIREPSRFVPPMSVTDAAGNKIRLTHYIPMPKAHIL